MLGFFPSGATAGLIKLPVLLQSQTKISYNNTTSYFILRLLCSSMKILKIYVRILTSCICFSLTTCFLSESELIHTCITFGYMSSRLHPLLQGSSLNPGPQQFCLHFFQRKQITNRLYNLTRKKLMATY